MMDMLLTVDYYGSILLVLLVAYYIVINYNKKECNIKAAGEGMQLGVEEIKFPPWWVYIDNTTHTSYWDSIHACKLAGMKYDENHIGYINMVRVFMAKGAEFDMAKIIANTFYPKPKIEKGDAFPYGRVNFDANNKVVFSKQYLKRMSIDKIVHNIIDKMDVPCMWSHDDNHLLTEEERLQEQKKRGPLRPKRPPCALN
jgi:hypothetical protein